MNIFDYAAIASAIFIPVALLAFGVVIWKFELGDCLLG